MFVVLAVRGTRLSPSNPPFTRVPESSRIPASSRSRNPASRSIVPSARASIARSAPQLRRLAQTNNARHIFRTCALPPFVAAAHHHRLNRRPAPHIHCAHTLRPMHLVTADRTKVATETSYVKLHLDRALHCIDMEKRAGLGSNLPNLFDRRHHPGRVVGQHHADQPRLRPDRPQNIHRVDEPARLRP